MGGVDPENFGVDKKNDVGRNFSVSGVGDVGVWGLQDFSMGQKVGVGQKQHSLRSSSFHYILSVPYIYKRHLLLQLV